MTTATGTRMTTGYAPVNGLRMYYEIHGTGRPLVLLHGGVGGHEMFGPNLEAFARGRQVIAVHLQGHGRTADIERPLSFESMGDDVAALITELGLERADIMGYSLGGGAALHAAIRHPRVVRRLVVASAPCRRAGFYPEVRAAFDQMGPAAAQWMKQSPLAGLYPEVDWERLFTKLGALLRTEYDWSKDVAGTQAPTMLVFADADCVQPAHIVELFGLLGGGRRDAGLDGSARPVTRLAIVPGATHYSILSFKEVAGLVSPFLDAELPERV
jgi:pimeloyl-ACP methyl ester carboxylesterase